MINPTSLRTYFYFSLVWGPVLALDLKEENVVSRQSSA